MFHNSTQKETWVFESERHLTRFRAEANATYCQKVSEAINHMTGCFIVCLAAFWWSNQWVLLQYPNGISCYLYLTGNGCQFLTSSEEQLLCKYYMKKLLEFCNLFRPPVPRSVLVSICSNNLWHVPCIYTYHREQLPLILNDFISILQWWSITLKTYS